RDSLRSGSDGGLLQLGVPLVSPLDQAADLSDDPATGPTYCQPDVGQFEKNHNLAEWKMEALPLAVEGADGQEAERLSETTVLTPTRMNTYSLSEMPEHFVGFLAQRGSFWSKVFNRIADVETLSTFSLRDQTIAQRTLSDSILKGAGPIQGIFHVEYEGGGEILGQWHGYTGPDGSLQGCFEFPPVQVNGRMTAGIGTFEQRFKPNDTAVVTWTFDGLYMSDGLPVGR
ncbi:MAG: hypothetical protein AAGF58_01395, partial [Pseudomonadota bacterium]